MHASKPGSGSDPVCRSERLTREKRLQRRAAFKNVYAKGRKVRGRYAVLFAFPNGRSEDRLGITATKRVGGASVRNRLKRRVREVFRRNAEPGRLLVEQKVDFVVNLREGADDAAFTELRDELCLLFLRGGGAR